MNKTRKIIFLLLILLISFTPVFAQSVKEGSKAPDFSLTLSTGEKVTLDSYNDKVLFLHFWGTWCPPCRAELPELDVLAKKLASQGQNAKMAFLGVAISDTQKDVTSFMKKNGYTFSAALDETGKVAFAYGIQGVPTSILISEEGKILKIHVGMMNKKQIEKFVADYAN